MMKNYSCVWCYLAAVSMMLIMMILNIWEISGNDKSHTIKIIRITKDDQRRFLSRAQGTCAREAQVIKDDTCASTVAKARIGALDTAGRGNSDTIACCEALEGLSQYRAWARAQVGVVVGWSCMSDIHQRRVKLSNETFEFFDFLKQNNQLLQCCGHHIYADSKS